MKAALYRTHGGPEVLEYADLPDPVPGPGDVVVKVAAVGLNRMDLLQRQGPAMMPGFTLPHVAGMDLAGEIVAVGDGVAASRVGERVVVTRRSPAGPATTAGAGWTTSAVRRRSSGANRDGGYGALRACRRRHVHVVADHIDLVEAASMPTVYSLAWHALFETGTPRDRRDAADPRGRQRRHDRRGAAGEASRRPGDRHGTHRGRAGPRPRRTEPTASSTPPRSASPTRSRTSPVAAARTWCSTTSGRRCSRESIRRCGPRAGSSSAARRPGPRWRSCCRRCTASA